MTQFTTCLMLAYAGMFVHLFTKADEEKAKPGFTFGGFLKDHLYHSFANIIAIFLLIYASAHDTVLSSQLPLTETIAMVIGYNSQSILKWAISKFKPGKQKAP